MGLEQPVTTSHTSPTHPGTRQESHFLGLSNQMWCPQNKSDCCRFSLILISYLSKTFFRRELQISFSLHHHHFRYCSHTKWTVLAYPRSKKIFFHGQKIRFMFFISYSCVERARLCSVVFYFNIIETSLSVIFL